MRGKLIVIEGGDGSGKTSVINLLKKRLSQDQFVFTREPGGLASSVAEKIRALILSSDLKDADPRTLFYLFWAARIQHITDVIWPALQSGKHVITDRFDAATYAYQIVGQCHPDLKDEFLRLRMLYVAELNPQYIFLDVNAAEGRRRAMLARAIDSNHFDERDAEFYVSVRAGYTGFFAACSQTPFVVDANLSQAFVAEESLLLIQKWVS